MNKEFTEGALGNESVEVTVNTQSAAHRGIPLITSSDVSKVNADFYERQAGVQRINVSPVALVKEGKFEEARDMLRAIRDSAVTAYNENPGRDINAQQNAIQAHLELLRVSDHKTPFLVHYKSELEALLVDDLKDAIKAVYQRQDFDNPTFALHQLLETLAKYGTGNEHQYFTKKAMASVDAVFADIVLHMDDKQRGKLRQVLEKNYSPDLQAHVVAVLTKRGVSLSSEQEIPMLETEALTL